MNTRRMAAILTTLSLFLFASLVAPDVQAATYSFTTFAVPGANIDAYSINASGQVTGSHWDGSGIHGFVYSNGTFTILDVPGAFNTFARSINASGQVTGSYGNGSGNHGFVYSNGTFTILDVPGALHTFARSINASGQVTGFYYDDSGSHGFVYSNGAFTTFDVPVAPPNSGNISAVTSINDSGQVTGSYVVWNTTLHESHGFMYGNSTFTTLDVPGTTATFPASINASGQVTGSYKDSKDSSYRERGFVYSGGTFTTFDVVPGASATHPASINASGQVTGSYGNGSGREHGFVYSGGTFTTFDVPGALDAEAASINASGQVTGSYGDSSGRHGFIATPVCVTPTVTVHTLTTALRGEFRITGSIAQDGAPLCALVLANGQVHVYLWRPLTQGRLRPDRAARRPGTDYLVRVLCGLVAVPANALPCFARCSIKTWTGVVARLVHRRHRRGR